MLSVLRSCLMWLPPVLYIPVYALLTVLSIVVLVKLVGAVMEIISAILSFITSWF